MEYEDTTSPLANGDELPDHPHNTTARKIISYGKVYDFEDGRPLRAGMHQSTLKVLMGGTRILSHTYSYAILNGRIYHTRDKVVVDVKTVDV